MKLATLKNGTCNGELWLVSMDLLRCVCVKDIATTMQVALDNWRYCFTPLQRRYQELNDGEIYGETFLQENCESPLPSPALLNVDPSCLNPADMLSEMKRNSTLGLSHCDGDENSMPEGFFSPPHAPIELMSKHEEVDFIADVVVVTGDVPRGASVERAGEYIRLVMLANDLAMVEDGVALFCPVNGVDGSEFPRAFSPVAVTVDELDPYWENFVLHLPLFSFVNGEVIEQARAVGGESSNFAALIAKAARQAPLRAGSIIGSGLLSNVYSTRDVVSMLAAGRRDYSGSSEGMYERLRLGDEVRVEMFNPEGFSIFGAINQMIK